MIVSMNYKEVVIVQNIGKIKNKVNCPRKRDGHVEVVDMIMIQAVKVLVIVK